MTGVREKVIECLTRLVATIHNGSVTLSPEFTTGNVVDPTCLESFVSGEVPCIKGMCVTIRRQKKDGDLPAGRPAFGLVGVTQTALNDTIGGNRTFVVLDVEPVSASSAVFFGLRLVLVPQPLFLRILGSLLVSRKRVAWTLDQLCLAVLEHLPDKASQMTVELFSAVRAQCLPLDTVPFLLTAAFHFTLHGYPNLRSGDIRSSRLLRPSAPAVPAFFRGVRGRPQGPSAALVAYILSLASSNWLVAMPASKPLILGILKVYFNKVRSPVVKDPVIALVCKFILRERHEAVRRGDPSVNAALHGACDALFAQAYMAVPAASLSSSVFLTFVQREGLSACAPWSWMLMYYRDLDNLIGRHGGFAQAPPCKPVGLSAEQLCALVVEAVVSGPVGPQPSGDIPALMVVIGRYALACWKRSQSDAAAVDRGAFFHGLHNYLLALRNPALRAFLHPLLWQAYARSADCLLSLAQHFLSDACVLRPGNTPWVVPEALWSSIKPPKGSVRTPPVFPETAFVEPAGRGRPVRIKKVATGRRR